MSAIWSRANELFDSLKKDRHYLHANPELGHDLPVTTKYVMERLTEIGLEPDEICPSGVTATIKGKKPGKTILLRADMDALPMPEINDLPYKSHTNVAHTCGHDAHTAMLLGAAQILKEKEDELEGNVKLMFQPAEELLNGSIAMIDAGILDGVDAAFGIHVMLDWMPPAIGYGSGFMSSSCDGFKVTIQGVGCHGAMPHLGKDPINVGVHIYSAFQNLVAREAPPRETVSLSFGEFSGGNNTNIIPDQVVLQGTLRCYNKDLRAKLVKRMHEIIDAAAKMFDVTCEYEVISDVPSIYSNPEMTAEIASYIKSDLGEEVVQDEEYKITASDDFANVADRVPTVYMMIGAKVEGNEYAHHNPNVLFSDDAMPFGAAVHATAAYNWLKNNK